jgi:probable Rubsico expression protein CbbX
LQKQQRENAMQRLDTDSGADTATTRETEEGFVDVGTAHRDSNLEEILDELERELVGLKPVKAYIRQVASLLLVARLREKVGLTSERPTLHMSFTGHPGTGKTTVAMRMAKILHHLGYLRRGHLVVATRDDLVGQYVGHTAPKTKETLKKAMGGVLFIDEAYYLYRAESERDYGQEAIEMLLQAMENQREDLVVILAGYQDRMETFFQYNPGFRSRVAHHISFPDYTLEELTTIAESMLRQQNYAFDAESRQAFVEYLALRMKQPLFANARSVRNAIDRIKLRQAGRLVREGGCIPKEQLVRIAASDVRQSRVFQEGSDVGSDGIENGGGDIQCEET